MSVRNMLLGVLALGMVAGTTNASAETVKGEYLAKFKSGKFNAPTLASLSDDLGGAELELAVPKQNVVLVKTDTAAISEQDVVTKLRARPDVEFVQPNFVYRTQLFLSLAKPDPVTAPANGDRGDDPLLSKDSDLDLANVKGAWATQTGSRKVVVAVIDTGVDYNHEDLAANMWHDPLDASVVGWDFVDNDSKPFDVTAPINFFTGAGNPGHGTHCAGNVGAVGDNKLGTSGVAKNVSIMALRMLSEEGQGETTAGIKSIDWAVEHGANIISASWGSEGASEDDQLLKEAIERAEKKGVLFVAAAGNTQPGDQDKADNDNNPERRAFPSSFDLPNIISVAASGQDGHLANFSHFGATTVDLAAPGEKSFSTVPNGRDAEAYLGGTIYEDSIDLAIMGRVPWNGTSMATPQVAGAAALVMSQHPDWTYTEVKKRLLDTVRPEPSLAGKTLTGGVLDVTRALTE